MTQPQSPSQSNLELLEALRKSALEELRFFSNIGKEARERWVVSEFLIRQKLTFSEDEIHSTNQHSKTDVEFRDARFQIKEILNPGSKRYEEVKVKYKRLMAANNLQNIIWPSYVRDVPPITRIYNMIVPEAYSLSIKSKYATEKVNLDILFYVTRTHAALIQRDEIDHEYISSIGWRSLSCLAGNQAIVLFAGRQAPAFLRSLQNGS